MRLAAPRLSKNSTMSSAAECDERRLSGKDWQILFPRSHRGIVLLAHDAGDLADVAQVMNGPRRQELAESYFS